MATQVLLAVESLLLRELLLDLLGREPDMEVVGEVTDPVDLLLAIEETQAKVVLHTFPDPEEPPGVCSHLFAEYPDLLVIGISPAADAAFACRQEVTVRALGNAGLAGVLAEIRAAMAEACGR
jgi:DNA-binding NarL/FixJ family response regulator